MTAGTSGVAGRALTGDQVLDELQFLAGVEHAIIVEYLSVQCALGHDLEAAEGGAATQQGRDAAQQALGLAQISMFRLKGLAIALVAAGRPAELGRASSITGASGPEIPLDPPTAAQLARMLDREEAIARAVDDRYARLRAAVTTDPVFDGELLERVRPVIVEDGPTHVSALASLRDALAGADPANLLRAIRRKPADAFEQRLLDVSDHSYHVILRALREQFAQDLFVARSFRAFADAVMTDGLDPINRVLVQRGLLPPFTQP